MDKPSVLVVGNLTEGYRFIGPFKDFDAAVQFSGGVDCDHWVATLEIPQGNALLAAAPELLAALKAHLPWKERPPQGWGVWQDAIDAIANAEGRGE